MTTQQLLEKLVSIPSVFPNEEKISVFIVDYLQHLGFTVKKVPTEKTRNNIVATFGKSKKYLGFYGHMDTVPRESYKDAYRVIKKGKRVMGLGTEDMKGGIAAILKTAEFAVKNKLPVKIIIGVDEENISQGAHDL